MKTFLDGFAIGVCLLLMIGLVVLIFYTSGFLKGMAFFGSGAVVTFSLIRVTKLVEKWTRQ